MNARIQIDMSHEGVRGSTVRPVTSGSLRTNREVGNRENVKDAKFELDRCVTDFDYAKWARKWGEAFVSARLYPGV